MCDSGCALQQFLQAWFPMENWMPILAAMVLGGIIGIEREIHHKPAGLRTNILICMGAAAFTLIAHHISKNTDAETRVIQGIITGVGFLGAGVLMHEQGNVHGLTTAATIWVVTAIGISCGARLYGIAIVVVISGIVVLAGLHSYEQKLRNNSQKRGNKSTENKDL